MNNFWLQRRLSVFAEVSMNTVLPFLCLHFLKRHLPNLCSLFQRNLRAHFSTSSRLTVTGCTQSRISCVGSSLYMSSENFSHVGSRFPAACLSGSVSIGFPHACLSLRVVTGSDNGPNFSEKIICWSRCWRQTAAGTDDSLARHEARNCPLYK